MSFPIALELEARWCLVVGNGAEAEQRVRQFKSRGAHVRWVYTTDHVSGLADESLQMEFEPEHLSDVWIAVLTQRDRAVAAKMQTLCDAARVWFCAVDQPEFNSFSHVALIEIDPLVIGISSGGRAPLLSRRVREGLQQLFDTDAVRRFFASVAELRSKTVPAERKATLLRALDGFAITGRVALPPERQDSPPEREAPSPGQSAETQQTQEPDSKA